MPATIERLRLTVAEVTYPLAPTEHPEALKTAIRQAVRGGGDFVEISLDDGRHLSIFLTANTAIIVAVDTVRLDTGEADGQQHEPLYPSTTGSYEEDYPFDII